MKNSYKIINQRRDQILRIVHTSEEVSVTELSKLLNVSPMTVRRDLEYMDKKGFLKRTHGGAKTLTSPLKNKSYDTMVAVEKIAQKASYYIEPNSTIFINSSLTALLSIKYASDKIFTIVTNNMDINTKDINANTNIILTGGELRYPKNALVGDIAINTLSNISADIAIIGCSGISAEKGITTNNVHEAKVNQQMVSHTNNLVVAVANRDKIGNNTNFTMCDISFIDILITDYDEVTEELQHIIDSGVEVINVK
ncbi:DeoR/GlpR family DNA-binding transcription regulator [Eremococcus coleocola]|uniref:DeoR/GlpR family DNA-binding transcription regulator n=1 Tax=Eremococcus coleocola TaxID=88132 RepID=UPI000401449F|nr:DeoR/GlpR family DNA-binding transcription regulator [Eremococcus coleocola]